jgi:hypothetical protein
MIYITSKEVGNEIIEVEIRLDDKCKNGHEDFSITADIYDKDRRGDWRFSKGGCCHDEILKYFPDFKIFVDLHLADFTGMPMYASTNGFYHIHKDSKEKFLSYYPEITEQEYTALKQTYEQLHYKFLLHKMGIVDRWKQNADKAIALLESLTGKKFEAKGKSRETLTDDDKIKIQECILLNKWRKKRAKAIKDKKLKYLKDTFNKEISEKTADYKMKVLFTKLNFKDNYIYYPHINTIAFNWKSWDKLTVEEYEEYLGKIKGHKDLPAECKFEYLGK